ncbi:hypothetical protein G4X40_04260 [Rhodococcus sp. D2-41]|uniref:hypothetical protein n=1 Tax=Speluncibacter jeojiensis TaxID=2710754 RepID=UPI00240EE2FF|nr:hypothetical protein [Rhodococcus sp. D2-41]MDG3009358.1 hypothetical protein [Rhodococcus sp. D2-41]
MLTQLSEPRMVFPNRSNAGTQVRGEVMFRQLICGLHEPFSERSQSSAKCCPDQVLRVRAQVFGPCRDRHSVKQTTGDQIDTGANASTAAGEHPRNGRWVRRNALSRKPSGCGDDRPVRLAFEVRRAQVRRHGERSRRVYPHHCRDRDQINVQAGRAGQDILGGYAMDRDSVWC